MMKLHVLEAILESLTSVIRFLTFPSPALSISEQQSFALVPALMMLWWQR